MLQLHSPFSLAARHFARGLTMIELMITIAIAAILLGIGVPSFQAVIQANRVTTVANDVVGALQFGRSEAVRRGAAVTVCGSLDQATCNASWQSGWIVRDGTGAVLRVWPAPRAGVVVAGGNVVFQPLGNADAARCFGISAGVNIRQVDVGAAGRVQTTRIIDPNVACP